MKDPFRAITGIVVLRNELLSRHSSFRIGGAARYFVKVYSHKALRQVILITRSMGMRYFILGAGTNILFSDRGFNGVVFQLHGCFRKVANHQGFFTCGSGILLDAVIRRACLESYGGAEYLAGIPGTIGGAIKGNAGAFGRSISDIVHSVEVLTPAGKEQILTCRDVAFRYRTSGLRDTTMIVSALLRLRKRKKSLITRRIKEYLIERHRRQPDGFSAGSFFKNPLPHSAGKLIDECGLKGLRMGGAEVSSLHGNWIVNRGSAKARDVMKLARTIKERVYEEKGIRLEEEVRVLR